MTQQIIDVGQLPNDGTGDPIRTAFIKINENFSDLFDVSTKTTVGNVAGLATNHTVFQTPVSSFSQGIFNIKTSSPTATQTIQINAHLNSTASEILYVGTNTLFSGPPLNQYNMDIASGNVRLQITSLVNTPLNVEIASQIISGE